MTILKAKTLEAEELLMAPCLRRTHHPSLHLGFYLSDSLEGVKHEGQASSERPLSSIGGTCSSRVWRSIAPRDFLGDGQTASQNTYRGVDLWV